MEKHQSFDLIINSWGLDSGHQHQTESEELCQVTHPIKKGGSSSRNGGVIFGASLASIFEN